MRETEQQAQAVRHIVSGLHKLVAWRDYLNWDFRLKLSEALRDVADEIDRGVMERSRRKMTPQLKRLRPAGTDTMGRPLFRLTS
jgi:hypothetical protein